GPGNGWTISTTAAGLAGVQGQIPINVNAQEEIGRIASKQVGIFQIDQSPPTITSYSGTLYDDRKDSDPDGAGLYRNPEHLDVQAADSYSGVASIQLLVDGQQVDTSHLATASCSSSGCPGTFSASFDLNPDSITAGDHTVTISVKDQVAG